MRRDDVEHALDALASKVPAPSADAASVIARGRRRVVRHRALILGISVVVVAAAAGVGAAARDQHNSAVSTPMPTTSTATPPTRPTTPIEPPTSAEPPAPLVFASATEGWICGTSFSYTTADFDAFKAGTKNVKVPATATARTGTQDQPALCDAVAGGNAWLLRGAADPDQPEIVRIRSAGADVRVFPFARIPHSSVVSIEFVDADNGWALVDRSAHGQADLYRTHDGGATWSVLLRGNAPLWGQLVFEDSRTGWASGFVLPTLATTTDGGRTWRRVAVPTPNGSTQFASVVPALVEGNVVVAYGAWDTDTGERLRPFMDVSTDGGHTWSLRSGPADETVPGGAATRIFSAADADHWALASANRLYLTDNGGRTWTERAQFAGISRIDDVTRASATAIFVSALSDMSNQSTVVLGTIDAGDNWTTVYGSAPPQRNPTVAPIPGGIAGCPTRTLTPAPPGDPPPGLVAAAIENIRTQRHYDPTVASVYRVGASPGGSFASVFTFNVGSCGKNVVDHSWVVELYGPAGQGGGGSTAQAQVVLAHYADGWHVFGRYH